MADETLNEPQPINLHELYRLQTDIGYDRSLTLPPHVLQDLAVHLRGISAVAAVLTAATDEETINLSSWMNSGLLDAVRTLTEGASDILYRADERARKGGAFGV